MNTPTNSPRKHVLSALIVGFVAGFTWAKLTLFEPIAQRRKRAEDFIRRVMEEAAP